MCTLAQKLEGISKQNFTYSFVVLKLRADYFLSKSLDQFLKIFAKNSKKSTEINNIKKLF